MKFKKIATVLGSALMVGSSVGLAAAAAYPTPFVQNGVANVAIVVGTAGAEASDMVAATNIGADLAKDLTAQSVNGVKTVTGGESFKLDKASNLFYFGDKLNDAYSTLDKDKVKFLADGVYNSGDVDTTTTQKVYLSDKTLGIISDKDFKNKAATVGFQWTSNENILNYTIAFDDTVAFSDINGTYMPLLGKEYYVLNATTSKLTLLDSANKKVLADGEKLTVDGKEVSVEWIDGSQVKLNINGEVTDKLEAGKAYELDDKSYVVVTDVLSSTRESTVQKVEFSLGSGKIILENGKDVIMGKDSEDSVDGLQAVIDPNGANTGIDSVTLVWNSYKDSFLAEGNPLVMPGLGVLGLSFDGLKYPATSEKISVENGETLTLMMDNFDLPLMTYVNDSSVVQGEENTPLIISKRTANFTAANITASNALLLTEGDRFVATYVTEDSSDAKTVYYEVRTAENDTSGNVLVELTDLIGSKDLKFEGVNEEEEANDNIVLNLTGMSSTSALINFSKNVVFNQVYSDKGMLITLPNASVAVPTMNFVEANADNDLGAGKLFSVTVKNNSDNDALYVQLSDQANITQAETSVDKVNMGIVKSELASKLSTDESNDEYDFSVEYFGAEVTADVFATVGGVVSESDSSLGTVTVLDNEASKMTGKNLIVVGGNCVNSVAASLLGLSAGANCLADFTAKTKVANGGFLIKSFAKAGEADKIALLVAGYSAADTKDKAAVYLANNNVDTTVGKQVTGTGVQAADVVIA